jgi:hypothetical protein
VQWRTSSGRGESVLHEVDARVAGVEGDRAIEGRSRFRKVALAEVDFGEVGLEERGVGQMLARRRCAADRAG